MYSNPLQFSLRGARIVNDLNGPQIAQLKGSHAPVYFICVVPARGNPIKISSPSLADLKPVHSAIARSIAKSSSSGSSLPQGYAAATENPSPPLSYAAGGEHSAARIRTQGHQQQQQQHQQQYPPGSDRRGRY